MEKRTLFAMLLFVLILGVSTHTFAQNLAYLPQIEADINLKKIEAAPKNATLKAILIICDNYISPENNKIAQSVRVDMGTMTQLLGVLERRNVLKVEKTILQGNKATLANIRNALKNMQVGNNDVTLVYFSGHGGMQNGKTFLVTADEKDLLRGEIETAMNAKSNRLKIIITDACSNDVDGLAATRSLSRSSQQIEAGMFDTIYKDLFLNYQGMMHISASTEGEYAWSNDNFGGFFTYHFVKEGLIKKPVSDWQAIFKNAKEKTSQMFMRMPAEQRAELAKEGIKNQTAKAFSMPLPKGGGNLAVNTNNNLPNNNNNNNLPNNNVKVQGTIIIENFTNQSVNFYIDENVAGTTWSAANQKMMSIAAGKMTTINQGVATVGFKKGANDQRYELKEGKYFFSFNNQMLELYNNNNNTTNNNNNTSSNNVKVQGTIVIENFTNQNVNFYIDNNAAGGTWNVANLTKMGVAANKTATINQGYAIVTFKQGTNDQYYELENGNYFFAIDENNKLDLFLRDDNINAQNFNTVAKLDYSQLLLGNWEWEDNSNGETVVTSFKRNNTFTDEYANETLGGSWSVSRETYEGNEYTILSFTIKQDNGKDLEMYYNMLVEEEYPEEVQLVFVVAYEGGEEIPYEEAAEFIQPTIFMYKTN